MHISLLYSSSSSSSSSRHGNHAHLEVLVVSGLPADVLQAPGPGVGLVGKAGGSGRGRRAQAGVLWVNGGKVVVLAGGGVPVLLYADSGAKLHEGVAAAAPRLGVARTGGRRASLQLAAAVPPPEGVPPGQGGELLGALELGNALLERRDVVGGPLGLRTDELVELVDGRADQLVKLLLNLRIACRF